jgi:hypothetical protein
MDYKTQLIIRTKDELSSEVLEHLKSLAILKGKNYSDLAVDLLISGMQAEGLPLPLRRPPPVPTESFPSSETHDVDRIFEISSNVLSCSDFEEAVRILADFVHDAHPYELLEMERGLQERMPDTDYERLMLKVKQTPQYMAFKDRV